MKNLSLNTAGEKASTAFATGLLVGAAGVAAAALALRGRIALASHLQQKEDELEARAAKIRQLDRQVAEEGRQRAEERRGRTEAERRLRAEKQEMEEEDGYNFTAIGTISTPFRDRRGTPRQGSITPLSRGKVTLDRGIVGYPALIGMTDFSHIWLVFVFHDNTNATVNGVAEERPVAAAAAAAASAEGEEGRQGERKGAPATATGSTEGVRVKGQLERWGGGAREYRRPRHKLRQTFLTKVCPPRLGKRIGVLGTRSPHRPNPLGLTMVKLDGVDLKTNSITVSGIDLVDGTPIIDIKPVVPHDVPRNMRVPEWVEDDPCLRRVVFTEEACEGLSKCVGEEARKSKSKFYGDIESFKAAVSEVLVQDVRSVHHGRGLASDELYECCFDGVIMFFVTTEQEMRVVSAG
ncbi:unnamed protein product [Ectocarpus sp. 12 AP-2014]